MGPRNLNSVKNSSGDSVVQTGLGIIWLVVVGEGMRSGGKLHVQREGGGPRAHRKWPTVKCVSKPAYWGKEGDVIRVGGWTRNAFFLE